MIFMFPISLLSQEIRVKSSIAEPIETETIFLRNEPNRGEFIHYDLHLTDISLEQKIREALHSFSRLENYRFVDTRRRISFSGGIGYVELYSATELKQRTGRSIRPQNMKDVSEAMSIEFVVTDQGTIKEKVVTDR